MMLSDHFSLAEMTISQTAERLGIPNVPTPEIIARLKAVAAKMEQVRAIVDQPIIVNSGYRSVAVNRAVGGVGTSAHSFGNACDFICPAFGSPGAVAKAIADSDIRFDQLIEEGSWVHISIDPRMRGQVLTMRNGKYTVGLGK